MWARAPAIPASSRGSREKRSTSRLGSCSKAVHHTDVAGLATIRAVIPPVDAQADALNAFAVAAVAVALALDLRFIAEHAEYGPGHCRLLGNYMRPVKWRQAASWSVATPSAPPRVSVNAK